MQALRQDEYRAQTAGVEFIVSPNEEVSRESINIAFGVCFVAESQKSAFKSLREFNIWYLIQELGSID
jgi:hypothetical protein